MLRGVISVTPGYTGGTKENPNYGEVCDDTTGHAEVVRIEFDPEQISYRDLLTVFFASHDPTTVNQQGHDVGPQYRSIIFYTTPEQKEEAERFIKEIDSSSQEGVPVVTEIEPLDAFFEAEDYHKNYFETHKDAAYCQLIINPKLEKVQKQFANLLANNK